MIILNYIDCRANTIVNTHLLGGMDSELFLIDKFRLPN
jgi:hypothetical protein